MLTQVFEMTELTSGFDIEDAYHNFTKIKTAAEEILQEHKNSTEKFSGVNYGDLSVVDVYLTYHMDGDIHYHILIEECSPTSYEFQEFMVESLKDKLGFCVIVECEW
jgi:hypothetical protein